MTRLKVFVPVEPELREHIWDGSGVVGSIESDSGRLRLDFEGDQELFPTFRERVQRAAERHTWTGPGPSGQGYPSSALAYVNPAAVETVGWWDCEEERLEIQKPNVLSQWLEAGEE